MNLKEHGIINFRDCGGYFTNKGKYIVEGKIYRAGHLDEAVTPLGWEWLAHKGIKCVCDLRSSEEIKKSPNIAAQKLSAELVSIPVNPQDSFFTTCSSLFDFLWFFYRNRPTKKECEEILEKFYISLVCECQESLRKVLLLCADSSRYPLLIHCTAGKDRTGLVVALLQELLGINRIDIFHEYTLSNDGLVSFQKKKMILSAFFMLFHQDRSALLPFIQVQPSFLSAAFQRIEQDVKSTSAFFKEILHIDKKDIASMRKTLLA